MKITRWMVVLMAATLALLWTACDNDDDNNSTTTTSLSASDKAFIESAAMANLEQRTFGSIAVQQGNDSLVRAWGQRMVDDHNASFDEIEEIAGHYSNVNLPASLSEARQEYRTQLLNTTGYAFDSLYLNTLSGDFGTLKTLYQNAIDNGIDNRIKTFASKYLPDIEVYQQQADSIIVIINNNNQDGQ